MISDSAYFRCWLSFRDTESMKSVWRSCAILFHFVRYKVQQEPEALKAGVFSYTLKHFPRDVFPPSDEMCWVEPESLNNPDGHNMENINYSCMCLQTSQWFPISFFPPEFFSIKYILNENIIFSREVLTDKKSNPTAFSGFTSGVTIVHADNSD